MSSAKRSSTVLLSPHDLVIIGRDTEGDEEHYLFQDRALLNPTPEEVAAAAAGISGVIEITKLKDYEGYVVVTGRQRTIAAREAGLETVECKIVKGEPVELVSKMIKENALQKAMGPLDKAKDAQKLIALYVEAGMEEKDAIAETAVSFGQTVQSIKDYITVLGFDPKVHKAIEQKKISAYEALTRLRKVPVEEQAEALKEALANREAPRVRADGRPAPERKKNMDKAVLQYMANDEGSPLLVEEGEEDYQLCRVAMLVLEICHGMATKAEVFREVPKFRNAYDRAKRALDKEEA